MGQQYNKVLKKRKRVAYHKRKNAAANAAASKSKK
jgi:hypothetical protein